MPDFNFMQQMEVTADKTSELTLHAITLPNGAHPVLIGRHGGETNKKYANAVLRISTQNAKQSRAGKKTTVEDVQRNRDADRRLYPKYVITGWSDTRESDKPVTVMCDGTNADFPFTEENCSDFLDALPPDMFDIVRDHFGDISNFRDMIVTEDDAVAKGKI